MSQRTELGEFQKALQHQLNEIKALISEFEEKRTAFGVSLVFALIIGIFISITFLFFCRVKAQAETAAEARSESQK